MHINYRIWWPDYLSVKEIEDVFLFGWFVSSTTDSVDVVVAFACPQVTVISRQSDIQGVLDKISAQMPVTLQEKCTFSLLGHCAVDMNGNKCKQGSYGCCNYDGLFDIRKLVSLERSNWIQLEYHYYGSVDRKTNLIPTIHHMHRDGLKISNVDLHVVVFETPRFGSHHFSLGGGSERVKTLKIPKWFEALHQKQLLIDLDTVVLAMNSAYTAKSYFGKHVDSKRFQRNLLTLMCVTWTLQLLAVFIASVSTSVYVIFQALHILLSFGSVSWMHLMLEKLFSNTWRNIGTRCCQILHWPFHLEVNDLRSQSCVEYAEKAAIHRHSMWSSIAADMLLGNIFGISLYSHAQTVSVWISKLVDDITNYMLRSGCVWLMGVPAGFKLNTELAGILGMICLNTIQIWSTFWFFVGPPFSYLVKGLAILGIIFGLTTPAALIMDIISLATLHVTTLHWLISCLYSVQIQAINAFWRLFSGRKWNPLRHRYDSYDYCVEQHIVGSLLFTPLLLLVPTTSVFYIFFTIIKINFSFICIVIEVIITHIHATPYLKIFLWLMRPRRYPSAISLDMRFCYDKTHQSMGTIENTPSLLVSFLRSKQLNLRDIISSHYKQAFSMVSGSIVTSSVYGIFVGRSFPSSLGIDLSSTKPWTSMPYTDYWYRCRDSVLDCLHPRQ